VFVASSVPDSPQLRLEALTLLVGGRVIACDRSAAWVHGVDVHTWAEHDVLPPVEVCVIRGNDPTELRGVRSHSRDLAPGDIVQLGSLMVTSPLRTALDLGCHLRRHDALAALDRFRAGFDLSAGQLQAQVPRFRRRRGVVQLRSLIPLSDPRAESVRESWTRLALLDAGLPGPELQWWVYVDGVPTYRLDLAYPRHRLAIEYDGAEFHEQPADRERDLARREHLRELGWTVIVVRSGDFTGNRLDGWIAQVRDLLTNQSTNLRWG